MTLEGPWHEPRMAEATSGWKQSRRILPGAFRGSRPCPLTPCPRPPASERCSTQGRNKDTKAFLHTCGHTHEYMLYTDFTGTGAQTRGSPWQRVSRCQVGGSLGACSSGERSPTHGPPGEVWGKPSPGQGRCGETERRLGRDRRPGLGLQQGSEQDAGAAGLEGK